MKCMWTLDLGKCLPWLTIVHLTTGGQSCSSAVCLSASCWSSGVLSVTAIRTGQQCSKDVVHVEAKGRVWESHPLARASTPANRGEQSGQRNTRSLCSPRSEQLFQGEPHIVEFSGSLLFPSDSSFDACLLMSPCLGRWNTGNN